MRERTGLTHMRRAETRWDRWGMLILLLLGAAASASADSSWPTFHGPNRDNIATEAGLLQQWPAGGPRVVWQFDACGKGYSAVSVAGGRVFFSGDFGDEECVLALGLDGRVQWKVANGKAWKGAQPGARTTPTWDDGLLYHLGPHGKLTAFDAGTGKPAWSVDIRERFSARLGLWGYTENLLVVDDKVLCMPGGAAGRVVALDKKTGQILWANTQIQDTAAYSSPILATHDGVQQMIALARNSVFGVDLATGRLLWTHPHPSFCDQNVTSPIYQEGQVFVASGHKAGARVARLRPAGQEPEEVWHGTTLDNCHGGVVLIAGHLYGSGCRMYNKGLVCIEFATGKVRYRAEEIGKVSLTYADGHLYCFDNDGVMLLVKATPEGARIVSRFSFPRSDQDHTLSHPVVCNGRLYLRHHGRLVAYDLRSGGI